jgi:hypothetical protein
VSRSKKFGNVMASPREVDEANDWLRKHAEDLKGLEDAKHLRPSPAAPQSPPGNTTAADPTCDFCQSPIFEEYRDAKQPEYCTRPKCQKKRHKFELQQEAVASGEFDLIGCVDDEEDEGEDPFESSDAVSDAEELPEKFFAEESVQPEVDLKSSSDAEDEEGEEGEEGEEEFDEDDGDAFDDEDEGLSDEVSEDDSEEDDEKSEDNPEGRNLNHQDKGQARTYKKDPL